ncbi:hypothetical protein [Iamia sp.]|uniref:hypothetical protein n=1 Tax=Iamia sp. TaxID=2722710 RepID=UPI002CCC5641|nr:hypothetical protein [Iamia sp.]HXH56161.1 hypothetical protein [Iamia sp.]
MTVVFCASTIGGPEPRVLARFVTDEGGLHVERLARREGHWVHDSSVAGYLSGHDDWAERITRERAVDIVASWGMAASIIDAPVVETAGA